MADFQQNLGNLNTENISILAGSVDARAEAQKIVNDLGLSFPVAYGLDLEETGRVLGGFYQQEKKFFHPSGFIIRPEGKVEVASYSSGPIGRVKADNVLKLVRHYKQNRD